MTAGAPLPRQVEALWIRALRSFATAKLAANTDPESAASRAYYAAFDAVCALFAFEGKWFRKHAGVEAAVHKELVHTGRWPEDLGKIYSQLQDLRLRSDYGLSSIVTVTEAADAIHKSELIMEAVRQAAPQPLPQAPPPPQP